MWSTLIPSLQRVPYTNKLCHILILYITITYTLQYNSAIDDKRPKVRKFVPGSLHEANQIGTSTKITNNLTQYLV